MLSDIRISCIGEGFQTSIHCQKYGDRELHVAGCITFEVKFSRTLYVFQDNHIQRLYSNSDIESTNLCIYLLEITFLFLT